MLSKLMQMDAVDDTAGVELPLLLLGGFRSMIDELHIELARQGHPDVRPGYGFAMQAVGSQGASTSEIGRRLGVSKQAAGKTVERLVKLGYVRRTQDPDDRRRQTVHLTDHGWDALQRSAAVFEQLRAQWAQAIGPSRLRELEADLRRLVPDHAVRLDVAGWLGP